MPDPAEELAALAEADLLRELRPVEILGGPWVARNGRRLLNFASNDYLGLTSHQAIGEAFHEGLDRYGHGAGASRLITGSQPPHLHFESQLANAKSSEAALLFSSGFAAAVGVLPAIVGKGDFIILDKLSHACLIDGARLSGATLRVFAHNDLAKLKALLKRIRESSADARILIATESVFSMDGDISPLAGIVDLKDEYGALLILDEAHGFGVMGPTGMGLAEELGLQQRIDFQMGTLSKAAGLSGAYLACSKTWQAWFVNRARSFVFSTAPPPALAHAASAALDLLRSKEGENLRNDLRERIAILRPDGAQTPIIPQIFGDNERALQASEALVNEGFLVPAIRFPTVPRGTARLRISLSASHPTDQVRQLARQLKRFQGVSI